MQHCRPGPAHRHTPYQCGRAAGAGGCGGGCGVDSGLCCNSGVVARSAPAWACCTLCLPGSSQTKRVEPPGAPQSSPVCAPLLLHQAAQACERAATSVTRSLTRVPCPTRTARQSQPTHSSRQRCARQVCAPAAAPGAVAAAAAACRKPAAAALAEHGPAGKQGPAGQQGGRKARGSRYKDQPNPSAHAHPATAGGSRGSCRQTCRAGQPPGAVPSRIRPLHATDG